MNKQQRNKQAIQAITYITEQVPRHCLSEISNAYKIWLYEHFINDIENAIKDVSSTKQPKEMALRYLEELKDTMLVPFRNEKHTEEELKSGI